MAIIVNLDVMMAKRKINSQELSEKNRYNSCKSIYSKNK